MIDIRRGDILLVDNPANPFDGAITQIDRLNSRDNRSEYSHGAIALDSSTIFESFQTARKNNVFDRFNGKEVLVARYKLIREDRCNAAINKLLEHDGDWYPWYRLFFYLLHLEKVIHWNSMVCSELVAKYLHELCKFDGIFEFEHYFGYSPDNLHDVFRRWTGFFDIVYEGKLTR